MRLSCKLLEPGGRQIPTGLAVFALFLADAIWLVATPAADGGHQTFGTLYLFGLGVTALTVIIARPGRK
jgi:hypothetical protein